jgi:hypothetical protein
MAKSETVSNKGIVYILTNPCLDGWIKIGMSEKDDIQDRLAELNNPSNIPLSFRAYAIYRVENPLSVEKGIHNLIDTIDDSLRAIEVKDSGRSRRREFYKISPEKAFEIFKQVSKMRGDEKFLEMIEPTIEDQQIDEILQQRKPKLNLKEIGIPEDAELTFVGDESITCIAKSNINKLFYDNLEFSISSLAIKLLREKCNWTAKSIAGGSYFKYKGLTLNDIRQQKEQENKNEEI